VSAVIDERSVGERVGMIFTSFRLAPDYGHLVGVEYGVDAVLWAWAHADE
jgi:hypothetical protein